MPRYNLGQKYEEKIKEILVMRELLPDALHGSDAGFYHQGKPYFLEIKNN